MERLMILIGLIMIAAGVLPQAAEGGSGQRSNIIFMVPDGMGLAQVTAARIFRNGPDGPPLAMETLEVIGCQRTHSADSTVTDSAAAASAWAMGEKFNNGELSCHSGADPFCRNQLPTILEMAKARGKATGLVVTSQISDATPAAFAAHVRSRRCEAEIVRQYLEAAEVDVILGGGLGQRRDSCPDYPISFAWPDRQAALLRLARTKGYQTVAGKAALHATIREGKVKILGMFEQNRRDKGKTPEMFRVDASLGYPEDEPTLAEMTTAALTVLEKDADGFFLLVEGSRIDWSSHANDLRGQIAETLAFDEALKVVLGWVAAKPGRKETTLIIVAPDHETGGLAINGPEGRLAQAGEFIKEGWAGRGHSATDTIIRSQGPGSDQLGKAVDNTAIYRVMADAIGF